MRDKLRPGEIACEGGIFNVVSAKKLTYTEHFEITQSAITVQMVVNVNVPTPEEWEDASQSEAYHLYAKCTSEIYPEVALRCEVQYRIRLYLFDDDKNKGGRDGLNLWGDGSNGKSVQPDLLQEGFGSHIVQPLPISHIQPNPRLDPNAPMTWPLDKDGARVLVSSEGKKKHGTLHNSVVLEYDSC